MKLIIKSYSNNHILKHLYNNQNKKYCRSFIIGLEDALKNLKSVSEVAYNDFIKHKLKASNGKDNYDKHLFIASCCELSIMNSFIVQSNQKETFVYEPKLRDDNRKNVEFSIIINNVKYNIEVKSPNFDNYNKKIAEGLKNKGHIMRADARLLSIETLTKIGVLTAPDSKVKDFLLDANKKFPIKTDNEKEINILFICWNEENDQPCTALKHPFNGLLTKKSWYKDDDGNIIQFSNIDLIFISDLYKNIVVHMFSEDKELPSLLTGVPYFEKHRKYGDKINPFLLPFSRNLLIKPQNEIKQSYIESLPIAFMDEVVDVIDEKYVSHFCSEFKSTFAISKR